jgi:hypothetical protein
MGSSASFPDYETALNYLRRFADDSYNITVLRRFLGENSCQVTGCVLTDQEVISQVARKVAQGNLLIARKRAVQYGAGGATPSVKEVVEPELKRWDKTEYIKQFLKEHELEPVIPKTKFKPNVPKKSPCVQEKADNDTLAQSYADTFKRVTGKEVDATATEQSPLEGQPYMHSADVSKCKAMAYHLENSGVLNRFNRYRQALPYARATADMNSLGDEKDSKTRQKKRKLKCLTMLPDTGEELNRALGLPEGTIKNEDLRNDTTGFRAAVYRSESDGKLILVPRDTQPDSLVDWKTNTDNGQGLDTAQYKAMSEITGTLKQNGVEFDVAGYSKGGGLAQEGGLVSDNSKVFVFNSAGLHENSLARTGQSSFADLSSRTHAFNAEGDFLTFMNNTQDPEQQIANTRFLRDQLEGDWKGLNKMKIKYRNPAMKQAAEDAWEEATWKASTSLFNPNPYHYYDDPDPNFEDYKKKYLKGIDTMITNAEEKLEKGEPFRLFPPVRADHKETLPNSIGLNWESKVRNGNPNLAKLKQHLVENVTDGLEKTMKEDKKSMQEFVKKCGCA